MRVTYRPIEKYPGERSLNVRPSPFGATWSTTLMQLDMELRKLGATEVVFQLDVAETDIRLDGYPRENARPKSPAVVISFESKHGPLQFATDVFPTWKDNVRAIALGLESLRRVDRYGITKHAEQYTGWRQIGSGIPMPSSAPMSMEEAREFIFRYAGPSNQWSHMRDSMGVAYRRAAKVLHPDKPTGSTELFKQLQEAKEVLGL